MKCKKLTYKKYNNSISPSIILGLVVEETPFYLKFRTARSELLISKELVLMLEDTNQEFIQEGQQ